jgi:hypothetical protein
MRAEHPEATIWITCVVVVPIGACRVGGEAVGEGVASWDGRLGQAADAVGPAGVGQALAVPVDGRAPRDIGVCNVDLVELPLPEAQGRAPLGAVERQRLELRQRSGRC